MDVRFVERGAIKLAGYALKTSSRNGENFKAIPRFWGTYMNDGSMRRLHNEDFIKNHDEYGVCFPEGADGSFDYVIGVELKEDAAETRGYHRAEIPAASYAVFTTHPSDADAFSAVIQQTWRDIFSSWFPGSGRAADTAGLSFELYDERCMSETGRVCEIWIPLIPA